MTAPQPRLSWEQAVEWARSAPDQALLVELCYYDDPIEAAAARFKASEEWDAIVSLLGLKPGDRVLEIGAGRGIVSWAFAASGCVVHAVEPNPSDLIGAGAIRRLFKSTGHTISILETVGEKLDLPSASFDFVVCRGVLHHVSDLDQVCGEAFRVLKPGGKFLAIKEHAADTPEELEAFLKSHPLHHLYGGEHAFPLATYLAALRRAGFERVRNFGPYDHPVTSAPAITSADIRAQLAHGLGARLPGWIAGPIVRSELVLGLYRRWLTRRAKTPGRLHSFLCEKPA